MKSALDSSARLPTLFSHAEATELPGSYVFTCVYSNKYIFFFFATLCNLGYLNSLSRD